MYSTLEALELCSSPDSMMNGLLSTNNCLTAPFCRISGKGSVFCPHEFTALRSRTAVKKPGHLTNFLPDSAPSRHRWTKLEFASCWRYYHRSGHFDIDFRHAAIYGVDGPLRGIGFRFGLICSSEQRSHKGAADRYRRARDRERKKSAWGTLTGVWVPHDTRDQIVDSSGAGRRRLRSVPGGSLAGSMWPPASSTTGGSVTAK